jgi:hypothetical protein
VTAGEARGGERGSVAKWLARLERYAVVLLALTGAAFLLVVYTPLANLLAMPLWGAVPAGPATADVAVVLSGGRYEDGSLNEPALERTIRAVRLYHEGRVPRLLFSGGPCCGRSASALMAALAMDLGVPKDAILLEEHSTRTHDSAVYSAALLRQSGMGSVILVTSPCTCRGHGSPSPRRAYPCTRFLRRSEICCSCRARANASRSCETRSTSIWPWPSTGLGDGSNGAMEDSGTRLAAVDQRMHRRRGRG